MRKKLFLLTLAGMLVFQSAAPIFAEEEAVVETEGAAEENVLTMDMMNEDLYEGAWISFAGGFDLYLPSDWNVSELTEENQEDGIVFAAGAPEGGLSVVVMANQMDEGYSLDALEAEFAERFEDVAYGYINDIPVISFTTDQKTIGVAFIDQDKVMYNVQLGMVEDAAEVDPILANILCSLSPSEEADEDSAADMN